MPDPTIARSRLRYGPRNFAILGVALFCIILGYVLLKGGSTTAAPILLVLGYCVFFPVGLAL